MGSSLSPCEAQWLNHITLVCWTYPLCRTLKEPPLIVHFTIPVEHMVTPCCLLSSTTQFLEPFSQSHFTLPHHNQYVTWENTYKIGEYMTNDVLSWVNSLGCDIIVPWKDYVKGLARRGHKEDTCRDETQSCYGVRVKGSWTKTKVWQLMLTWKAPTLI